MQAQPAPNFSLIDPRYLDPTDPEWIRSDPVETEYDKLIKAAKANLTPTKSLKAYEEAFDEFAVWMGKNGQDITKTTGENIAAWIQDKSSDWAASTLWSR